MKIQPNQLNNNTYGMKYTNKAYKYTNTIKNKNTILLDNNKSINIISESNNNNLLYKLYVLRDELGNWIKSKLVYYINSKNRLVKLSMNTKDIINKEIDK